MPPIIQANITTTLCHHINLCTLPSSLAHSNPLHKNTAHVPAFAAKNHIVSPHNLVLSTPSPPSEPRLGYTFSRQSTHGRIKYRGSTRGAVMRDSDVARSQTSANEVFVFLFSALPVDFVCLDTCPCEAPLAAGAGAGAESEPLRDRRESQKQRMYMGTRAYFMSGCRRMLYRKT